MVRKIVIAGLAAVAALSGAIGPASAASADAAAPGNPASVTPAAAAAAAPAQALSGVSCVSARYCVAVGSGPSGPLALLWNGATWRKTAVPLPAGSSQGYLLSVSCPSAAYCVAVGRYGMQPIVYTLVETWNGKAWTPSTLPGGYGTYAASVSCGAVRDCVAVGELYPLNLGEVQPFAESLHGTTWTMRTVSLPAGAVSATLSAVSCASAARCVAAGEYYTARGGSLLFQSWNGTAFTRMKAAVPAGMPVLGGVSCASAANCSAVAVSGSTYPFTSFAEHWNGKQWSVVRVAWPKGTANPVLAAVSCAVPGSCVAVGDFGTTAKSVVSRAAAASYNGRAWMAVSVPAPPAGQSSALGSVSCVSAADCLAVGQVGPPSGLTSSALAGFWNGKRWRLVTVS